MRHGTNCGPCHGMSLCSIAEMTPHWHRSFVHVQSQTIFPMTDSEKFTFEDLFSGGILTFLQGYCQGESALT